MGRGVQNITGNATPDIGGVYAYSVGTLHATDREISDNDIKWVLYKKEQAGTWRKLNGPVKTGRHVTYTFGQIARGHEFLLEAYAFNPERSAPPGLIITPGPGEPRIIKAEILDAHGNTFRADPHFMDRVTLKVTTENMVGEVVRLSLWEKDLVDDDLLWGSQNFRVTERNGIISQTITLTAAMKQKGGASMLQEGFKQELFLYAEANGTAVSSAQTAVLLAERSQPTTVRGGGLRPAHVPRGNMPAVVGGNAGEGQTCGERYCLKRGDKNELIREVNIRLAGFGGNVPTDEFTDRTEKMIRQFQKDYMKVPETGKICGNVLRAIDDFGTRYNFNFPDVLCRCGECNGFGNNKFAEQKQDAGIAESGRKYEYPGVHRSLLWALRAVVFYTSVVEKDLNYTVRSISSGYRCHNDNRQHHRSSTNHMGKALDIHFNKSGSRTQVVADIEEIRLKIYNKYLGAKWDWKNRNIFNLESTAVGATTWVHYDVREFDLEYLEDKFFVKTLAAADGEKLMTMAAPNFPQLCVCNGAAGALNQTTRINANATNNFTVDDGKAALRIIYNKYGRDMSEIIERMYRDETRHFQSSQYKATGTGGMEAHGDAPYYGWDNSFFEANPEYMPMGLWSAFENKGLSGQGGNAQVTDRKKEFVIMPSVLGGMEYKVFYINKHGGNYARWHSTNAAAQETYKTYLNEIRPRFTNEFAQDSVAP